MDVGSLYTNFQGHFAVELYLLAVHYAGLIAAIRIVHYLVTNEQSPYPGAYFINVHVKACHVGGVAPVKAIAQGAPLVAVISHYPRAIRNTRQCRIKMQGRKEILAHFNILRKNGEGEQGQKANSNGIS